MTGTWQILRSLLSEARSLSDLKEDIFKYMVRRYGEHAADELREKMKGLPFKEFKRHAAVEYLDPKLDGLIDDMARTAITLHKSRQAASPEASPGRTTAPSGRTFSDPEAASDRQARIDAMRQARTSPEGGQSAAQALMTPGKGGAHAVGSAGQHQPKQQPSVAAGIEPQQTNPNVRKNQSPSGLVRAQREVDKETREKGVAAGVKLARELGVPTTAERTTEHPDTGEKSIQIWGPDRVFKHMDIDRSPGGPGGKTDAERKAQAHRASKFAQAGQIDPDRLEKIKRGLLKRNAAPTKLGPDRPGSFHGERWKPHGREEDVPMSRPDPATGNWVRGSRTMNPKDTGLEFIWNKYTGKWQSPSVFAAQEAERGAQMKARGVGLRGPASQGPASDQDFGDERTQQSGSPFDDSDGTDPDAPAFPDED